MAGELGYSTSTIATLLGHKAANVTERYVHRRIDRGVLAAADNVSRHVEAAMTKKPSAKVVAFPGSP